MKERVMNTHNRLSAIEKRLYLGAKKGPGSKLVRLTPDECRTINESIARAKVAIATGAGRESLSAEDQFTYDCVVELEAAC